MLAALAVSALASTGPAHAAALAAELLAHLEKPSPFIKDVLSSAKVCAPCNAIRIMAELLAVDVFAALDLATLGAMARRSRVVTFSAGEQVCRIGESSDSMFVLVRGETEAWIDSDGQRIVLGRGRSGSVFGELGVITGRPRSASIQVDSPTATVVTIPRDVIDDLLGRDLRATRRILSVVSGYLADTLSSTVARHAH